jgi:hypothetical protein
VLAEIAFAAGPVPAFLLSSGFISQPVGGNKDTSVTFAPTFFFLGGLELGT